MVLRHGSRRIDVHTRAAGFFQHLPRDRAGSARLIEFRILREPSVF